MQRLLAPLRAFASLRAAGACFQANGAVRNLNLHEAHSLELLNKFGVTTPKLGLANTPAEAAAVAKRIGIIGVVMRALRLSLMLHTIHSTFFISGFVLFLIILSFL